jgi:hypothetical protein
LVDRAGGARGLRPDGPLSYSVVGRQVVPQFLGEHDHPWLRTLLEEHERFTGRPRRELEARLREPLPCEAPPRKLALAAQVMDRLQRSQPSAAVPPRLARTLVFVRLPGRPPLQGRCCPAWRRSWVSPPVS